MKYEHYSYDNLIQGMWLKILIFLVLLRITFYRAFSKKNKNKKIEENGRFGPTKNIKKYKSGQFDAQ